MIAGIQICLVHKFHKTHKGILSTTPFDPQTLCLDPERSSPRYHETCLAPESLEESSAAVSKPCSVWLRLLVVQNLEEACRLPVRMQKQQAQQLAMDAA